MGKHEIQPPRNTLAEGVGRRINLTVRAFKESGAAGKGLTMAAAQTQESTSSSKSTSAGGTRSGQYDAPVGGGDHAAGSSSGGLTGWLRTGDRKRERASSPCEST